MKAPKFNPIFVLIVITLCTVGIHTPGYAAPKTAQKLAIAEPKTETVIMKSAQLQPKTEPKVAPSKPAPATPATKNEPVVAPYKRTTQKEKRAAKKQRKLDKATQKKEPRRTLRDMNYAQLKESKERYLKDGAKDGAIKFLEKMIPMCNNLEELCVIMLELADLLFDTGSLEKAGKMYKEFSKLYPGNAKVEYASYKAVLCSFYATLDAERDQTKTKDTIELAETFLTRSEIFKNHTADVTNILTSCRKRLFDNEVVIFNFYTGRGMYRSAQKRLEGIRKEFLTLIPDVEPQILTFECDLAEKTHNKELFKQKQEELLLKFPTQHQELVLAQSSKKSFLHRF